LSEYFILAYHYNKKGSMVVEYCQDCFRKYKNVGDINEYKIVISVKDRPKGALPVVYTPPVLAANKTPTDAVKLDAVKTIDKTRYAARESFEGLSIGVDPGRPQIKDRDVKNYLIGLKNDKKRI
jgi:hypothetical protein